MFHQIFEFALEHEIIEKTQINTLIVFLFLLDCKI
jgi:hypothetical protein